MVSGAVTTWPGGCRFCDAHQELSIIDGIIYVDIKHDPNCYSVKHDGALVKGEYRRHAEPSSIIIDTEQWLQVLITAKLRGENPTDALSNLLDAYINDWEWKDWHND